jgi:hypothetical protein
VNIYVETNFVLELVFEQEQCGSCEQILELCEQDAATISCESDYDLRPQDALVYASVVSHLRSNLPSKSCFLNRNSKDFDSPDIVAALARYNCRIIPRFDSGYDFIRSQIRS